MEPRERAREARNMFRLPIPLADIKMPQWKEHLNPACVQTL